jgi:hypothetical protein
VPDHKKAAVDNMKLVDDMIQLKDPENAAQIALLTGSILMHCLLYIGDGLHRIASIRPTDL